MIFKPINFTCKGCGAPLLYSPTNNCLVCEFCSNVESIPLSDIEIEEYDFYDAIRYLRTHKTKNIKKEVKCNKCAVTFELSPYSLSSNCPYCHTPAIVDFIKDIKPQSVLPFTINKKKANVEFKKWIGSLWFAPNKLQEIVRGNDKLVGFYLPHWTYDAETDTKYRGRRGTIYYVTVQKRVMVDGREEMVEEREARVKWTNVRGRVYNSFDDVTVGASKTISQSILENLSPWDTKRLVPFDKRYLAGFESEEYTIGLDNGFEIAKMKMNRIIRRDIKKDIGGDKQEIISMDTEYKNTTYKNTLFPVWVAKFKWNGKVYNYAINGQNGKVTGERPYSIIKITIFILSVAIIIGAVAYFSELVHP